MVACLHGDETCGWEAIQRFKDSGYELKKSLKVILANEEAYNEGVRFIDKDLNRCFPGDPQGEDREERLAADIQEELEGLKILDIHSTASREAPFAIIIGDTEEEIGLAKSTGVENLIDFSAFEGGMGTELEVVTVELSRSTGEPVEDAYDVLVNFLAAEGLINEEFEKSDPEFFQVFDTSDGEGYEFKAKNFQKVEKGEVYAEKEGDQKIASKEFYPVLMSTDGYDDMIGFLARKLDI